MGITIKLQEIVDGSIKWFEAKYKFCSEGINIRKEFDDFHASVAECEALQGKKKGHNGFKYESCGDVGLIVRIHELYPLVHRKMEITNNSIFVSFACGLLAKRKTFKVILTKFIEQV